MIVLLAIFMVTTLISSQNININFTTDTVNQPMIINNQLQAPFTLIDSKYDCSLQYLYTYNQSKQQLDQNQPDNITVDGLTQTAYFTLFTKYSNIVPDLSQNSCQPPACILVITNNCDTALTYNNYFDILILEITSGNYKVQMAYNIYCLGSYPNNPIEWGLVLQIVFITFGIAIFAFYSRAWSLQGIGIKINVWLIVIFNILLIIGGIIAFFSKTGIDICLIALSFFLGILGIAITTNEFLFLFRLKFLGIRIIKIKSFEFRIMQLVSIASGVAFTVGWWFSDHNIILNNILCICIIISCIKILKFTSLKLAALSFCITISLELIVVIAIFFKTGNSYNNLFINQYNYPIELQIPSLNPIYNQKCGWIPFTSVIYPGMLLSYLRRFDTSRNTLVYIITATVLFFIGAIAWLFTTLGPISLPFGLISQPCMFGLVCMFAYRRRQIRVLWGGEFYDQEFANQQDMQHAMQLMAVDKGRRQTIQKKLIEELKQFNDKESRNRSDIDNDVIRSKFLR